MVELEVVRAVAIRELLHASTELEHLHPVLVLTPTDSWMPMEEEPEEQEKPPDYPQEVWDQFLEDSRGTPIPQELRDLNRRVYSLAGVELPKDVRLIRKTTFERAWDDESRFEAFVSKMGGTKPIVLRFSRPYLTEGGDRAFVLVTVLYSWTGCGHVDLDQLTRSPEGWVVEESDTYLFW